MESATDQCIERNGRHFDVVTGRLRVDDSHERTWSLSSGSNERWVSRVRRNTWRTFGDLGRIRVGIKSTADSVFVRDDWEELPRSRRPENELLLPLLTHRNVTAWSAPSTPRTRVLYPYDLDSHKRVVLDLDRFPGARGYLDSCRERLESRTYLMDAGRRWYELWVPQKPAAWARPKVVFPDISVEPRFSVDRSGAVVNGDCYWIGFDEFEHDDLAYLLVAVANSPLAVQFYDVLCGNKLYAGRRRWMTQYVNRLPVPDPGSPLAQRLIQSSRALCDSPGGDDELLDDVRRLVDELFAR